MAANAGVPDRLFKQHGHWKSELAKDGYIKDSVKSVQAAGHVGHVEPVLCVFYGCVYACGAVCTTDLNQIGGWQGDGDVTCCSGMGREIHVSVG